jgi:GxxExxY protein
MNANERELVLRDEAYSVVGAAIDVINALGHGLLEKPYERALVVELGLRKIPYWTQPKFAVDYKGVCVGEYVPDLIAFDKLLIEIKCVDQIGRADIGQVINYLCITQLPVGLTLNFRHPKLEWERVALSR